MNTMDVMEALRVDSLKSLAKQAGIPKSVTRKAELIKALHDFFESDPAAFIDRLSPVERNLLAEALYNDNRVEPFVFSSKYNVDCPRPDRYGKRVSLIQMVISTDPDSDEIEVPDMVAELLRPLVPKPAAAKAVTVERVPESLDLTQGRSDADPTDVRSIHVFSGEQTVFKELRRVLQLVQGGKVRIQPKSGRPTPATQRAIAASLAAPDFSLELPEEEKNAYTLESGPVRGHAWAQLVQQCGWCRASAGVLELTKEGRQLLQNPSAQALRLGVKRLARDDETDELRRINHIRGQSGNARHWMTQPSERRLTILEGIAEWPPNEWLDFAEAYRFLNARGHIFTVTGYPETLYFAEQRYGYICNNDDIDRQYLRVFLFESLATLGLVDVAYVYPHYLWPELSGNWGTDEMDFCSRYDGLLYVRLNPLGLYCLGMSGKYEPPPAQKRELFTLLPTQEIVLVAGQQLLPGDVAMLDLFARKKNDHVWCISQRLILDYLECGGSLEDILRFLNENATDGIPNSVNMFLNDVQSNLDAVVQAEAAWLVEFEDPGIATLISRDSKAGRLCLLAGDRHVVLAKKNERAFRTALKKLGYVLPK